jgi:hypothetical protein
MVDLIRGEDKTILLNFTGTYNLTGVTALEVTFPGPLVKSIGDGVTVNSTTQAQVVLTNAETLAFASGIGLGLQLQIDKSSVRKIKQVDGVLNIFNPRY